MPTIDDYKTIPETAKLLNLTRQGVWYRIWHDKIKAIKKGDIFLVHITEIERVKREAV